MCCPVFEQPRIQPPDDADTETGSGIFTSSAAQVSETLKGGEVTRELLWQH